MTPLAHGCEQEFFYRPSQAVDYFWAVLLQPGLITQILPWCPVPVCACAQQALLGCLQSIRANAVVAHKAGTVNFPCPQLCFSCRDTFAGALYGRSRGSGQGGGLLG